MTTPTPAPADTQTGMFRGKMRRVSPAHRPCSPEDDRALRAIKRKQDKLDVERILAVKQAVANGASSYAVGESVGLSHSHVQRIVKGLYDELLVKAGKA